MDKDKLDKLKDIKIENFVWVIYIIIIILSYYANSLEKKFFLYDDEKSKKEYQELMIFIFLILLIVYYYFAQDGYNKIMELNENDSNKKKVLSYAAFIGSFLILISGIIFLYILIVDNDRICSECGYRQRVECIVYDFIFNIFSIERTIDHSASGNRAITVFRT